MMTESEEQQALFKWAELERGRYPELAMMYHVPNGGKRNAATAARLKREGVKPGVPDICLPVARGGYHGLYIELKRSDGGRLSASQANWRDALSLQGFRVEVCYGMEAAMAVIIEYLS